MGVLHLKAQLNAINNICSNKTSADKSLRVPSSQASVKNTQVCLGSCATCLYLGTWQKVENQLPRVEGSRREDAGLSNKGQMKLEALRIF